MAVPVSRLNKQFIIEDDAGDDGGEDAGNCFFTIKY
jgi:hypothetical protein